MCKCKVISGGELKVVCITVRCFLSKNYSLLCNERGFNKKSPYLAKKDLGKEYLQKAKYLNSNTGLLFVSKIFNPLKLLGKIFLKMLWFKSSIQQTIKYFELLHLSVIMYFWKIHKKRYFTYAQYGKPCRVCFFKSFYTSAKSSPY